MKLTTYCPNCGTQMTSKRWGEEDWFLCSYCHSRFFSHRSFRQKWASRNGGPVEPEGARPAPPVTGSAPGAVK